MKKYQIRVSETQVREYISEGENANEADDKVMAGDCGEGRLIDSLINDVEITEVECLRTKTTPEPDAYMKSELHKQSDTE